MQTNSSMKQFIRLLTGFLSLAVIIGSLFAATHRQGILDYFALRNYKPDARVVALADATTMRDDTRRIFYVNHPELDQKADFQTKCQTAEQSIVLGCYVQRKGIFLLDVSEPRLSGVIEVTAAHEVLHAQYDRLSATEKKHIDQLTTDFFANLNNDRIKKTIEQYRAKDPSVVPNELHSILGTEVRTLTPELEAYYGRYFNDRQQIVGYSEKYEQTFVQLTNQVENFDAQLKSLKATIDSNQQEIQGQNADIELQKSRLDSLINAGKTDEYNAAVPTFNASVNSYNALINRTRALINQYNSIVEERNKIATTEQQLVEAINSNIIPQQTE